MSSNTPQRDDTDVIAARILAQVVDLIIMIIIFILFLFLLSFTGGFISGLMGFSGDSIISAFSAIGVLIGGLGSLGYSFIFEAMWDGQTIGKRLAGIRVISETGDRLSPSNAFVRNIPAIVAFGWIAYLVAFISMAATDRRQRLFDILAGTVVVREDFNTP